MLGLFLFLIIMSFLVAVVCRYGFPNRFNNFETCLIIGGSLLCGLLLMGIVSWNATSDYDVLNGQVTSKVMERVSCSHSYQCHCHTVSSGYGKSRSSHTECDTCYEHPYDQDWVVKSTIGNFDINRVDRQGLDEPHRWTIVNKNDPVSDTETVRNYVLAAPNSLFNVSKFANDNATFGKYFPSYPKVYDYYHFDHVINMGVTGLKIKDYNVAMADIMRNIGPAKQANIVVVFVPIDNRAYLQALERHWLGSKKNDIVVVIGITHYPQIAWAGAFTFGKSAKNELLVVKMRDTIENVNDVSKVDDVVAQIKVNAEYYYNRQSMSNYEYLKHDYFPSSKALIISGVFYLIVLLALLVFFWLKDVTMNGIANGETSGYNGNTSKSFSNLNRFNNSRKFK